MALMKCKECGGPVSSEAKSCPKCGAKPPKRTSLLTWVIGGLFAWGVGSCVLRQQAAPTPAAQKPVAQAAAAAAADTKPAIPINVESGWEYTQETDPMTSKAAKYAKLLSENSLSLDFPYAGKNYGQITVRQHPKWGLDVLVQVEKGQMLCHSYDESCKVTIRFDDGPPQRFGGAEPEDNSSTVIFLRDEARFLKEASKAKRILVQATFYQNGEQLLEFKTDKPLGWPPKL